MQASISNGSDSKPHLGHSSRGGVNVATFDELADAEVLRTILENGGIEAWVQDERRLQRYWFGTDPQAGIHLRVPESMVEQAEKLFLSHSNAAIILQRAVRCPSCQSYRVEYPAMTRKNALPTLVAQVAVALRFTKHECYCESCHYTWVRVLPRPESNC